MLPSLNKSTLAAEPSTPVIPVPSEVPLRQAMRRFGVYAGVLAALFCVPLFQLASLAVNSELYSHIPLMPLVCVYMIWVTRHRLPSTVSPSPAGAVVLVGIGLVVLLAYCLIRVQGIALARNDSLAMLIGAFVCFLLSAFCFCLGWGLLRVVSLPAAMLFFLVPFPTVIKNGLEVFLQHSSAEAADWLFKLTNVPVHREGVIFGLPGITIQVAEECSGIRSSFVLFITGLIGGYMFLGNPWHRFWFSLVTIPLGIIRNGFRVVVISMLCVYMSPDMIHSPIHRRGGPIFFVLSLIPLFGLLVLLRKRERKWKAQSGKRKAESGK